MSAEERTQTLQAVLELARQNVAAMQTLCGLLQNAPPAPPRPTPEEQEIIDLLLEPDSVLTGMQIAERLGGFGDNGTVKRRLADMIRKGLLLNKRPGYCLPGNA